MVSEGYKELSGIRCSKKVAKTLQGWKKEVCFQQ